MGGGNHLRSELHRPKVSIITVCYQAKDRLEETIRSVTGQTYTNKEYIIIDGGSTDGTLQIIGNYARHIDKLLSEPDSGIYDAMNKGLSQTSSDSEYVMFMNAGDLFYDSEVLEKVLPGRRGETHLYGNLFKDGKFVAQPARLGSFFLSTKMLCHQSILFSTALHRNYPYDVNYRISADFKAVLEMIRDGNQFEKVNETICTYEGGGVSDTNREELFRQRLEILQDHPKLNRMYRGKAFLKRCLPFRKQMRVR